MRTFFGLTAVIVISFTVSHRSGLGPPDPISSNRRPISKVFAPSSVEQTKPGTGKFVIFTREQIGNDWDFTAGAWECIPSRPDVPVTKRLEFCHSSWHAWPLLGTYCNVRDGSHPNFVKLQVDKGPTDCDVNLYDIDYRTWNVRCIWRGYRLRAFGVLGESVFCENDKDWLVLNIPSRKMSKEAPFTPLEVDGDYWLVRKPGEVDGCWSYDTKKSEYCGHFGPVDQSRYSIPEFKLSPDGKTMVSLMADEIRLPVQRGSTKGRMILQRTKGRMIIQRHGDSEDQSVPIEFYYDFENPHFIGTEIEFLSPNQLEFRALSQVWRVDIATKKVSTSAEPEIERKVTSQENLVRDPVPDYLRTKMDGVHHLGKASLAIAFLIHLGLLPEPPPSPDYTCGVSPDGRHFL